MPKACTTEGCDGEVSDSARPGTTACKNCRAGVGRWMKRRPAEVLLRRTKLTLYGERIDTVIDERGLKEKRRG